MPVERLGLVSEACDSRLLVPLLDRDNPLGDVARPRFLPKGFPSAHRGFDRGDLQDWFGLLGVVVNPPKEVMAKAAMILDRAMASPKTLRYRREFYEERTG